MLDISCFEREKSPEKSAALAWSRSLHTRPSSIRGGQPASLSVVQLSVQEVRLEDVFLLKENFNDTIWNWLTD